MKKITTLLGSLAALLAISCSQPAQNNTLKKIVFPGDYPDPSIVRDGKDFYMTHSSFTYCPGLLVWHSTDLENWEPVSRAVGMHDYSIFAPEITKVGDLFYIYYPTSAGANYVVTAKDPAGPWSEPVKISVGGIDPGLAKDSDGKMYLYTNDGFATPLSDDGLDGTGSPTKVYDGWEFPAEWETEGMWLESPKIFEKDGWYYLVSAEGGTAGPATSHMCVVARSKSVLGPWENSPYNPLVHTYTADEEWWSKGHGTIFDDAEGNWYIVYHSYRNSFHTLGRTTIIESINWTEDGWPVLADESLDFVEDTPESAQYRTLRDFSNPLMWAQWAAGFEGDSLWTITAVDRSYSVEAEFSLEQGSKASLMLFYNENAWCGIDADSQHIWLRITNERNMVKTEKSLDGTNWKTVGSGIDVSGYHHNNHQGFFALRPAIRLSEGATVKSFNYKAL